METDKALWIFPLTGICPCMFLNFLLSTEDFYITEPREAPSLKSTEYNSEDLQSQFSSK